jgi:uncharacterized membrane protein
MDISDDKFNLKDDEQSDDITITFQIDPKDLETGNTAYTFYVQASGNIDDDAYTGSSTESGDEDSEGLTILNDEFVIINNIQFNPTSVSCGDTVELTAEVWNVDNSNLDDDEVYVKVYNKELGLNKVIEFEDGIDSLDSEDISLSFDLPEDVKEGSYVIEFTAYDDEDRGNDDIFLAGEDDDDESVFKETLTIEEGSCSTTPTASIAASLQSDAKAGEELVVKATIVNTATTSKTFKVSASGYAEWASSATLDKTTFTLNAGASQDVLITLNVAKDAEGESKFNVEVLEGDKFLSQPVTITIEKASFLPSFSGFASLGDNAYLYGIGALNILLVVVIIFVAVKVARKK